MRLLQRGYVECDEGGVQRKGNERVVGGVTLLGRGELNFVPSRHLERGKVSRIRKNSASVSMHGGIGSIRTYCTVVGVKARI
jgi:hypothetical protein